eukprot:SAG22_NODE_58_length_23645_cov_16.637943_21_plen_209_part_00
MPAQHLFRCAPAQPKTACPPACPAPPAPLPLPAGQVKQCYKLHSNAWAEPGARAGGGAAAASAGSDSSTAKSEVEKPSPIIEEWLLDFDQNVIQGIVYGYKDQEDGLEISTSRVVKAEGNVFWTQSGSRYRLGQVDANFQAEMEDEGCWEDENSLHNIMMEVRQPAAAAAATARRSVHHRPRAHTGMSRRAFPCTAASLSAADQVDLA